MLRFRLHFLPYVPKLELQLSQDNAARYGRYGGKCYMSFVGNLPGFPAVKKF